MSEPLRALFVGDGVLGHRTLAAQLREALADNPAVDASFATVPPPNRLERLLLRRGRRLGDADLFALRWRLRWSWRARRLLARRRREADVAVINTQASALLMRGPMARIPTVLSVDATVGQFTRLAYLGPPDAWTPRQLRLMRRLERRALAGAAAIVAWTEWNAAALRDEYDLGDARVETIHPGLDREWWEEAAARREPHDGPLRVLFVGDDVERKGLPTLLEAIERLGGEARLDVVSAEPVAEGPLVTAQRGVAAHSDALRDLYAGADVFALPTRADAVPWVVLEAMAAGLPVVASDVGAIGELLGGNGELVRPGDAQRLSEALRRLADPERRRRLATAAQARVRERYDAERQLQRLLELLERVSGRSGAVGGGRGRISRRTLVVAGAGVAGVAVAAPYLALIPDDEFERLVAAELGIDAGLAAQLLERAREEYGAAEYDVRATAFALAVRDPASLLLPRGLRERAVAGLVDPMLSAPAASLGYAITGDDPGGTGACAGLVRDR